MAPARDRLAMVRLAVADNPRFLVSTVEIRRAGISYTVDTLRDFTSRNRHKDSYYFILGLDAFWEIDTWKDFRQLFSLCHFIVTSRPGSRDSNPLQGTSVAVRRLFCYDSRQRVHRHRSGTTLHFLKLTDFAISASNIRAKVNQGKSIRYLMPLAVEAYIKKRGLYR